MEASKKTAPAMGAVSPFVPFGTLPEDEQIAQLIKMFDLPPVMRTPKVIWTNGDTRTGFYERQDPTHPLFDPTFPEPIGGRRSGRASRHYWTIDILRWRIRQATLGNK